LSNNYSCPVVNYHILEPDVCSLLQLPWI